MCAVTSITYCAILLRNIPKSIIVGILAYLINWYKTINLYAEVHALHWINAFQLHLNIKSLPTIEGTITPVELGW